MLVFLYNVSIDCLFLALHLLAHPIRLLVSSDREKQHAGAQQQKLMAATKVFTIDSYDRYDTNLGVDKASPDLCKSQFSIHQSHQSLPDTSAEAGLPTETGLKVNSAECLGMAPVLSQLLPANLGRRMQQPFRRRYKFEEAAEATRISNFLLQILAPL